MINGDGDEGASDVLPAAQPAAKATLPAVDDAITATTANEDLAALLFENSVFVYELESVVTSDVEDGLIQ